MVERVAGPGHPRRPRANRWSPVDAWIAAEGSVAPSGAWWVALEDNIGVGAAVAFVATDGERFEVDGRALDSWDEALTWPAGSWTPGPVPARSSGRHLIVPGAQRLADLRRCA